MDVQRAYNQRLAMLGHRSQEPTLTPEQSAPRSPEATELLRLNRAVQFRTRLSLIERKLFSLKSYLRDQPQDSAARAEAEQLEAMYVQLLSGNAA